MTESEAKTKWCPMVHSNNATGWHDHKKNGDEITFQARCIGTACMMWRWNPRHVTTDGYCGLAGKP